MNLRNIQRGTPLVLDLLRECAATADQLAHDLGVSFPLIVGILIDLNGRGVIRDSGVRLNNQVLWELSHVEERGRPAARSR